MKRSILVKQLISEGFTEKLISKLNDKQLSELTERIVVSAEKLKSDPQIQALADDPNTEVEVQELEKEVETKKVKKPKVKEWVENVVNKHYHPEVTTKKEIYEMIGAMSDSIDNSNASKNYFDVNEQPAPSKPAPVKEPGTKPGKPKRENPFEPKHKPKPKAKVDLPDELKFSQIMSLNEKKK